MVHLIIQLRTAIGEHTNLAKESLIFQLTVLAMLEDVVNLR